MATPPVLLETWLQALERYARALAAYVAIVDEVAQKTRPKARTAYREALAAAMFLSSPGDVAVPGGQGAALATAAFALFARLEGVREALGSGSSAAADPSLVEEATRRMSRTFVEGTGRKTAELLGAGAAARAASLAGGQALAAAWAPAVAGGSPAVVAGAYTAGPKTAAGAALYATVLVAWSRAGVGISAFAESAKDEALGIAPDGPGSVEAAVAARGHMHPLQAMGVTFGLYGSAGRRSAPGPGAVTIDATLPQATTSVSYDMSRLVDAKAAARFGALAHIFTGLNFRLVDRLRTITETAIPSGDRPRAQIVVGAGVGVVRTADGGGSYQRLEGALEDAAYAAIGAGPRPRIPRLGSLLEEAVFSPNAAGAVGGPPRTVFSPELLLKDYDAQAETLEPYISLDELGQTLVQRFGEVYDETPPASAEALKAAVLGEGESRDLYRTYIASAISEVSKQGAEKRLVRGEAAGSQKVVALFGGRAAAMRGVRQETLLTSVVQLRRAISAASGQLARAYDRLGGGDRAQGIYGDAGAGAGRDKTAMAASLARQRMEALALYRGVVEEALFSHRKRPAGRIAQVVEKMDTVEPRPSLKLYVLERGDTSAPQ